MNMIRTIYFIAQADFLERTRQYSFLLMIGFTMLAAYFFVPPADAGYVTLYLEEVRGIYNSAWVGGSVSLSTTMFLSLFGFYLVKNSIDRDKQSKVGEIIASTPIKKLYYIIGKWISNFAVLTIIVMAIMVIALIMQWVRGEVIEVELWQLWSPFLFMTLPMMSVIASLALFFESVKVLQGGIGNVIYFVFYIIFSTSKVFDLLGTGIITSDMIADLSAIKTSYTGTYGIGILIQAGPSETFLWNGVDWTEALIKQQLVLPLVAVLLLPVAALLFRGFKGDTGRGIKTNNNNIVEETKRVTFFPRIRAVELTPVGVNESFWTLVRAEWYLMMKGASLIWYIIATILSVLCLTLPVASSSQWMIWPLTWIWPILLWSNMGCREIRNNTQYIVASSPRYVARQLTAVWIAGVLLSFVTGLGMAIRFILEGEVEQLIYWLTAAVFIPSLALASGVFTRSNRTFEVVYMLIWYMGPFNKMDYLDFMGTTSAEGTTWVTNTGFNPWAVGFVYLIVSAGLLVVAYTSRSRLAQSS
ncbi:ABC-2 transporter permease [Paenibacillus sp. GSMTC-2017]|uniref:ABC transporter permease n=1 Tax=Paenibacillus sp. GSMTC-2017 TaxID=2794350 RepID=UPI0018D95167|nr:ABC-2 transporter permease [Paenibacillus sp. GSMTC-2017]MBH5319885.1 ABC-2 transporter permease [Paenibacillus sp. GSMTC-2017]